MQLTSEPQCDLCCEKKCIPLYFVKDFEHGIKGAWLMVRCQRCGFIFIWPKPTQAEIASYYPSTYYSYGGGGGIDWLFQMVYRLDARRISRLVGDHGKILDVGCGSGDALNHMQKLGDYERWGLEIDKQAVARGRNNGLSIMEGAITDSGFTHRDFSLIRMAHVIEHMVDPKASLKRAFDALAPGGILIGETPNTQCFDMRIFKQYWGGYQGPRHTCLFNTDNLQRTLGEIGYVNISVAPRLRTVGWSGSIQNLLVDKWGVPVAPNGRVRWYLLLILPFLPFTVIQSFFVKTATMAFVAQKPTCNCL